MARRWMTKHAAVAQVTPLKKSCFKREDVMVFVVDVTLDPAIRALAWWSCAI